MFSEFLLFCYYLPLGKGVPLHFNNLESPPPKDNLCQVWSKLALWFWRRSQKCKSLQMDDGQRAIRKAHLSFQLRWAKNKIFIFKYIYAKFHSHWRRIECMHFGYLAFHTCVLVNKGHPVFCCFFRIVKNFFECLCLCFRYTMYLQSGLFQWHTESLHRGWFL
jgi:hypothetical protein